MLNRKEAYAKMCDKIDCDKIKTAKLIRDAIAGDEFFFGMYKIIFHDIKVQSGKKLYMISLYKKNTLETRVLVDIN